MRTRSNIAVIASIFLAILVHPGWAADIIPQNRRTTWNPGLNAVGGIPNRTTIHVTLSPSGGDDTQAIQNALDNCPANQVVQLTTGTFKITGQGLNLHTPDITLRGMGPGTRATGGNLSDDTKSVLKGGGTGTFLVKADRQTNGSYAILYVSPNNGGGDFGASINLASDATLGTYSLTLVSNPGIQVGEIVFVDENTDNDPDVFWGPVHDGPGGGSRRWFVRQDRSLNQIMEVTAVSGNTITFATPFHHTFKTSEAAQLTRYNGPFLHKVGIEDLALMGGEGGDGHGNLALGNCAYCWVKNIEAYWAVGTSVGFYSTYRSVLRDSYIHESPSPYPGGGGYLTGMNYGASDNLFENNIMWNDDKEIVMRGTGGGNVVGYNYMDDSWIASYPFDSEAGLNAGHYTTPHMELLEGNYSQNFKGDSYWGNSIDITVFRNHLSALRAAAPPLNTYTFNINGVNYPYGDYGTRTAVDVQAYSFRQNFVGNILGLPNQTFQPGPSPFAPQTGWAFEALNTWAPDGISPMWSMGGDQSHQAIDGNSSWVSTTYQTQLRDGNWDWVTKSQTWLGIGGTQGNPLGAPQTIPDSLYLTAKPAFFGGLTWPWVDPSTGTVSTLPAKARFEGMGNAPTITSFAPTSGVVGTTVTITGSKLTGATSVKFNGTAATFTVVSATSITTAVPTGATTGAIAVTTPSGTVTSTTSFTVTSATNHAPVASAQSVTTAEDTAKAITLAATDADGNALTYAIVANPAHGTLTGSGTARTYTPATNYNGADSFTFSANDGTVNSNVATVSITVTAVNDAPVASAQSVTTAEDTAKAITLVAIDAEGNALTYTIVANPAHGTLTGTGTARTYTPTANYNGADSFTFKANDGTVDSNTATVSITVTAVNDVPVATAQSVTTAMNTAKAITLAGTDVEGSALTYAIVASPTHGTLTGTGAARTYTPTTGYTGADSFTFTVNDGTATSAAATVSITVTAITNTAPVANAQSVTTAEDTAKAITLVATDANGDALTYTIMANPAHGALTGTGTALTYTPAANYTGADSFTFKANDGTVDSNTATVSITVTAVNDAPVVSAATATPSPVTGTTTSLSATASDTDNAETTLIYTWTVSGPAAVTFSVNGTNAAKASTATFSKAGAYIFTVTAKDPGGAIGTKTVSVTVAQTAGTWEISPTSASVQPFKTIDFNATMSDQFGNAMAIQPTITWTVSGGGTIDANGLFTAGAGVASPSGGITAVTYQVTASSGSQTAIAPITVSDASAGTIGGSSGGGGGGGSCGAGALAGLLIGLAMMLRLRSRRH